MEIILYFFRDTISGIHYFIYAFVLIFLMFSIIGYLFKQKYARVEIKLNSSQPTVAPSQVENKKLSRKEKRAIKKQQKMKNKQSLPTQPVVNQTGINQAMGNKVLGQTVGANSLNQSTQVVSQNVQSPTLNTVSQMQTQSVQQPVLQGSNTNVIVNNQTNANQPIPEIK